MIQEVESLCFYLGVVLFSLGLISLVIKRQWRLGIITLLIADIPLAFAIAFPKILASWCIANNIIFSSSTGMIVGVIASIIIYALLFFIYNKYLKGFFYKESLTVKTNSSNSSEDNKTDKNSNDFTFLSKITSLFKKDLHNKQNKEKVTLKIDKGYADPSLFANVKRKD